MLSRVADAIYWMNRYIERAENYARFLDVNFNLSLELKKTEEQWMPLVITTGDVADFKERFEKSDKSSIIYFMGLDPLNTNSIYNSISKARENARSVRPELTIEVWEQINSLYYDVKRGLDERVWENKDPRFFFQSIKKSIQLLYGILDSTISRSDGWHFGKIGQLLERADKTSRVIDVKYHILLPSLGAVGTSIDLIQWSALLKSVSAYDMYRKKYGKLDPMHISEFLILDKAFPRSILKCITSAEQCMNNISGVSPTNHNLAQRELGKLKANLEYTDIKEIVKSGLHENLEDIQTKLNDVSNAIFDTFFSIDKLFSLKQTQNQNQ